MQAVRHIVFCVLGAGLLTVLLASGLQPAAETPGAAPREMLSEYGFFTGNMADLVPAEDVVPYQLNTPLFSDYAEKSRFIQLPADSAITYDSVDVLHFPIGTTLIKTFWYPQDFRHPEKGRRLLETRLLMHETGGWKALVYIWNEEQTDAWLEVAGDRKPVSFTNANGHTVSLDYSIPNLNQCKGCHNTNEVMTPIGPTARQLNGDYDYASGPENQLQHWIKAGMLRGLDDASHAPRAPVWNDPQTGTLADRARIWLEINCAHCHKQNGPASTSGLFLLASEKDPVKIGIRKTPVAAGRGSADLQFDIVPGHPEKSILVYRMESTDPGIMMPELSRKLTHKEGLELVKEWIRQMK
ncbi:SO2930 family diheme c-type cytochrome [Chitinophaga japonensis]|uniref:Putative repeat protein (TIGR03806 family) n=1 Tax=Chitinophaga japonensis TaxID=104662 RepID=A0A562T5Q9_CHIJA|nr:SO2930 family diheme c-type cytochrome [Chitinophaga japonensis]TWI88340.1 putative repeat protein (TIGR03806 family) [Chitinophaga japonensis]